jgi:DNA-binding LacI/PurR family transcriptional regulator
MGSGLKRQGRVGIRDVAKAAGVSPTTVSHALSGKGRISKRTRNRVIEKAEKLGYKPNRSAQQLVTGNSGLIALYAGNSSTPTGRLTSALPDYPFIMNIAMSASVEAIEQGLSMALSSQTSEASGLLQMGVDGAVIVDPEVKDPVNEEFFEAGLPVVTVGRVLGVPEEMNEHWVDVDHNKVTIEVLEHLKKRGAKRVAVISAPVGPSYVNDSLEGYKAWCESTGQEPIFHTLEGRDYEQETRRVTKVLLDEKDRPDAIFCHLQPVSVEVLRAVIAEGLSVPDEIMIATMSDDTKVNNLDGSGMPDLTGCNLHPEQVAREAVRMLASLIAGEEPANRHVYIPAEITARESTNRK